jgi:hypothetical protein
MKTARIAGALSLMLIVAGSLIFGPEALAADAPSPAWSAIAVTGPTDLAPRSSEIQLATVKAEGGTFTLSFEGSTTGPIAFDAEASAIETALDGLPSVALPGGEIAVSGGPGGSGGDHPYFVSFGGELAGIDVAQMNADGSALSGPTAEVNVSTQTQGGSPGTGEIAAYAQNVGGLVTDGSPITMNVELPVGLEAPASVASEGWSCVVNGARSTVTCTSSEDVKPGTPTKDILIPVSVNAASTGTLEGHIRVSGGGAANVGTYAEPITISWSPAKPGFQAFNAGAYDADGTETTQAGSHPYGAATAVFVNTVLAPAGIVVPAGDPKTISVDLPPGFLGNPIATEQCAEGGECDANEIVGTVSPILESFGATPGGNGSLDSVFNLESPIGYPAEFKFTIIAEVIRVVGSLNSETDYSLNVSSPNTPQVYGVYGVFFNFWGGPAESSHDSERCGETGNTCGEPNTGENTAFLTMPTDCSLQAAQPEPPLVTLNLDTWLSIGQFTTSPYHVPRTTGCDKLHFELGSFTFDPSETNSDSPASFQTEITVPPEGLTDPEKLTTPEPKTTVVKLAKGVTLNASGADGLEACSESQIGLKNQIDPSTGLPKPEPEPNPLRFSKEENHCPEASRIGTGELQTALLKETLHGALYLAAQGNGNPFGSLFAVYLVIEDPRNGIFIKLPGEVEADRQTGQLTVSFENLPQVPFTRLKLSLKGGDRSPLASPTTCGSYSSTATVTPWSAPESGPPTEKADGFEINQGPAGGPCARTPQERPFDVGWKAGSVAAGAGQHSPFEFQITRPDGSQELQSLELVTPPGLAATLKGIPYCSEAAVDEIDGRTGKEEQASPACPGASQIGTTLTSAGAGPTPYYTAGKVYLAGPYKGAPLSVVAVTPAVAGPLDLGNVAVRTALFVNPETAQITAKTDPLPEFLDGVQLRIRDVRIKLDRSDFTLNPTSCEPSSVGLIPHGNSGAVATRSVRFQVGNCNALAFHPKLALSLKGGTRRDRYPALTATLSQKPGQANIGSVAVRLPHSEFLEQGHIKTICTRVQFNAVPRACPAKSIYGHAEAESPLLGYKLTGPVYLRSSDHKLPDLVAALQGPAEQPIEIDLDGRIDSVHGGIRSSFELVPDAPVSKFVLHMQGGKKGLLVNSTNLCTAKAKARRATVRMVGQNNKRADQSAVLANQCRKHKQHHKKHKHPSKHKPAHKSSLLRRLGVGW